MSIKIYNSPRYRRMVSWWLKKEILEYPNVKISDAIQRKADALYKAGCDSAIVFGAHFRWDHLPVFDQLHAYIAECAEAMHQRGMAFIDHYSNCLAARPDYGAASGPGAFKDRSHITLNEIRIEPEKWVWNNTPIESWRMVDTTTGKPHYNPHYANVQFCVNNPDFRAGLAAYTRKWYNETHCDGLMSDDSFFNARFYTCSCEHCRAKFGRPLPPADDLNFWGNWDNADFRDWITMRYQSVAELNAVVRSALPHDFPLMNCCSGSIYSASNESALSIDEYMRSSNWIMLEMCGDTPPESGVYTARLASQLYQLAVAKKYGVPAVGLGYAYYAPPANFIWAFNQFLGAGTWISTLKHRLGMDNKYCEMLPMEADIADGGFNFEKSHPELFDGEAVTDSAVYFARNTRDYYGGLNSDYSLDYIRTVSDLFEEGVKFEVVTSIPHPSSNIRKLYVPSAAILSREELRDLEIFRLAGGVIYASGPCGVYDIDCRRRVKPYIEELEINDIKRAKEWPHDTWKNAEPERCKNAPGWRKVKENMYWNPQRAQDDAGVPDGVAVAGLQGFFDRSYQLADGRTVKHFLAKKFTRTLNEELEAKREIRTASNSLVTDLFPVNTLNSYEITAAEGYSSGTLVLPLNGGTFTPIEFKNGKASITLPENCFYFMIVYNK